MLKLFNHLLWKLTLWLPNDSAKQFQLKGKSEEVVVVAVHCGEDVATNTESDLQHYVAPDRSEQGVITI